jgi:hypothetical protein
VLHHHAIFSAIKEMFKKQQLNCQTQLCPKQYDNNQLTSSQPYFS